MKVRNIIVLFIAFLNYCTSEVIIPTSNWILDIKNENGTDEMIELRPGVLTKVILVLRHETYIDYWDRFFDRANYTIVTKDSYNIMFYPNEEFNIIPSLSLEYIAYIGLNCNNDIYKDVYTLNFDIIDKKDLDGNNIENHNLKINPVKIKINNNATLIDIEPIETNLVAGGYSLFRITNEIYNIKKFIIKPEEYNNEKFRIDNIEIKPFFERNAFGKEENDHGILFEYKFGSFLEYQNLQGEINTTFKLIIDCGYEWFKRACFEISPKSQMVNFTINEKEKLTLNESVKEAILYNIENVTPERDKTNNIQIKMDISVAPVIITCDLIGEGKDEKNDIIQYKNYILNSGQNIIKFNNLNSNKEYKGECIFSSITFNKTEFKITMGNDKDRDFITPLYPSKRSYCTPQCLEFTLTSDYLEKLEYQIKLFTNSVTKLCNKTMTEDENIISRIKGNFICENPEIDINDEYYKNKAIICIGTSPSYNSENITDKDVDELNTYFSEKVDKFTSLVNNTIDANFYYKDDLLYLKLVDLKRYYDLNPPDLKKIKLEVVTDGGMAKRSKLNFRINSSHEQPIECFYNKEMKVNDTKRFLNLKHFKEGSKSVILYPNEEKTFETHLKDLKDNNIYSLYMNCYNLPGARIRYQQTNIFNPYTYLYTDIEGDQNIVEKHKVTINCNKKNNKADPKCLKGTYNNLNEMLKTKMPETDINEEVEKFSKFSNNVKTILIDEIFKNFDEEMRQTNNYSKSIPNIINKEQYLINLDCSIYVNESYNEINDMEYKKCRENKKIKQKKIIEFLKNNLNCQHLSLLISKNGISNNVEENIKYIILLIGEVTNNADSFTEGDSEILLNMITCLQENYEDYWNQVKEYLQEKGISNKIISAVKEDISNLLINSMSNLVKVLHFDEIDNYISENEKNMTNKGLMSSKKGKKIHKNMKEFMKNFNEFGDGLYNLSDSLIINITINNEYKEKSLEEEKDIDEKAIKYQDKGIVLLLNPQSMMKKFNAYAMQIINYDSPLISIKTDDNINNNILNTFISITLYDNKGNEIIVDKIPEDIRPKILYDKEFYKSMNNCYFYNEEIEDLSEKGVSINDNYIYNGRDYIKCTSEHLTCFTAGNNYYKTPLVKSNIDPGLIRIIILGSILAVILILVIIIIIVKKKRRKNTIDNVDKIEKDMINMKLYD